MPDFTFNDLTIEPVPSPDRYGNFLVKIGSRVLGKVGSRELVDYAEMAADSDSDAETISGDPHTWDSETWTSVKPYLWAVFKEEANKS